MALRRDATEATCRAAACRKIPQGAQIGQPNKLIKSSKHFTSELSDDPHVTTCIHISHALNRSKSALIAAAILSQLVGSEAKQKINY